MGFEPTVPSREQLISSQPPSTTRPSLPEYGAPKRTRTSDLRFRKPSLYPAELWAPDCYLENFKTKTIISALPADYVHRQMGSDSVTRPTTADPSAKVQRATSLARGPLEQGIHPKFAPTDSVAHFHNISQLPALQGLSLRARE